MSTQNGSATPSRADAVVVGGGLAGLTAATVLARAGQSVVLFEKASKAGGRAATRQEGGFRFNLGPHALYRGGQGVQILRELGVGVRGGAPPTRGMLGLRESALYPLPGGFTSLMRSRLLSARGKWEMLRLLAGLDRMNLAPLDRRTVDDWAENDLRHPDVREYLKALFRLATYSNCPERQSAGAALAQMRLATRGVYYLHGGWQTLVDGLRAAAKKAGVSLVTGAKVGAVECGQAVRGVRLASQQYCAARSVVIAAGPRTAARLVEGGGQTELRRWADEALPVRAASLDLGLQALPNRRNWFILGIDQPLYFSVHSAFAELAPEGGALVHAAEYLRPENLAASPSPERELEDLVDRAQPGWREQVLFRRCLPALVVSHAVVTAAQGGLGGRPGPAVPGIDNLFVAGDWVGKQGMLADAAMASARRAAEMIVMSKLHARAA